MSAMIRLLIIGILLLQFCTGCTSTGESEGIDKVLNLYGGKAVWSKGIVASTHKSELRGKFFEVRISGADIGDDVGLSASNCALLIYQSFSGTEKNSYSFVRVIITKDGKEFQHDFAADRLRIVERQLVRLDQVVKLLKENRYEALLRLFNTSVVKKTDKTQFEKEQFEVDSTFGEINNYVTQGFLFFDGEIDGEIKDMLKLSGLLIREKQNTNFNIVVDLAKQEQSLCGMSFKR